MPAVLAAGAKGASSRQAGGRHIAADHQHVIAPRLVSASGLVGFVGMNPGD